MSRSVQARIKSQATDEYDMYGNKSRGDGRWTGLRGVLDMPARMVSVVGISFKKMVGEGSD